MEQLEEIIIKSIKTLRSSKKQPNEEAIHKVIKKDLPEVSMDKLKERLNHLLQKEKILNKPHKGKSSYYNIKEVCPETPHPPSHSPETPHPSSHPPETPHPPSHPPEIPHPPSHPPETLVRKAKISNQSNDKTDMSAKLKEYVKTDTFETFFEMFLEFRYSVDTKFEKYFQENEKETKTTFETKVEILENEIKILQKQNQELKQESKSYLKIIETLVEGTHIDAPWQTVSSKSNANKTASETEREVLLLKNKFKHLDHYQINGDKNLNEEEYHETNIKRKEKENKNTHNNKRPQHCITENYIRNQKDIQKRKAVIPGQRTYAETTSYGKKVLFLGDSHLRRINKNRVNNSFKNAKCVIKSFSGAKIDDLQHYAIPPLEQEKPDIAVIHVGSNNVTYDNLGDDPNVIAEKIIQIGQRCIEYGVKDVIISSIFVKHSLTLSAFIRKINDELRVLCELCNFKFVSNDNIIRKHLCGDGVHLTTLGTNILAGNIVDFIKEFILNVNINDID